MLTNEERVVPGRRQLFEVRARLQDLQGNIVPDLHSRIESRDARIRDLEGKQGRERLPDDRQGLTHRFVIKSSDEVSKGYLTVGLYPDGRVGEVFLKMDKQGGTVSGFCDAWAIAISLLLQTGTPLETIVAKYRGARFEPSGLTETPDIRSCSSPVDYAVRYLEQRFLAKASAA